MRSLRTPPLRTPTSAQTCRFPVAFLTTEKPDRLIQSYFTMELAHALAIRERAGALAPAGAAAASQQIRERTRLTKETARRSRSVAVRPREGEKRGRRRV